MEAYKLRREDCYSETPGRGRLLSHNKGTSDNVAQGTLGFIMVSKDTVFPLDPRAGLRALTGYKQFLCSFLLSFLDLMT